MKSHNLHILFDYFALSSHLHMLLLVVILSLVHSHALHLISLVERSLIIHDHFLLLHGNLVVYYWLPVGVLHGHSSSRNGWWRIRIWIVGIIVAHSWGWLRKNRSSLRKLDLNGLLDHHLSLSTISSLLHHRNSLSSLHLLLALIYDNHLRSLLKSWIWSPTSIWIVMLRIRRAKVKISSLRVHEPLNSFSLLS